MSGLSLLNKDFQIVHFNGGAMYGKLGVAGALISSDEFSTVTSKGKGKNVDLVLEYTGADEFFTLEYIAFHQTSEAPREALRNVAVWVHSEKPDISAYTSRFDSLLPPTYEKLDVAERPTPAPVGIFTLAKKNVTPVKLGPVSGRFIHIKLIDNYAHANMMSFGNISIVGSSGKNADEANTTVAAYTAPVGVQPPAGAVSGGMDWAAMFAAAGQEEPLTVTKISPEDKAKLVKIDVVAPTFNRKAVNLVHSSFESQINKVSLFLMSKIPVMDAVEAVRAGSATAEQTEVAAAFTSMTLAAQYEGPHEVNYFYADPTIDPETLEIVLTYLSLPSVNVQVTKNIVLPANVTTPYAIFAANGTASALLTDQRDGYLDEAVVVIGNQGRVGMNAKGLGKRAAMTKVDFARGVATAIKAQEESIEASLASLSLSSAADSVPFARQLFVFGQVFMLHLATDATEIETYLPKQAPPAGNCLEHFPYTKVATSSTFNELVLDHPRPTFVVFNGSEVGDRLTPYVIELARLFSQFKVECDVVTFNPTLNFIDDVVESGDKDGALRLYVKNDAVPEKFGVTQLDSAIENAQGLKVTVYDIPVFVAKIMDQLRREVAGEPLLDEEEDEDEEEDQEEENAAAKVSMPQMDFLISFVEKYASAAFANVDKSNLNISADLSQKALLARVAADQVSRTVSQHLSANGLGATLAYRMPPATVEAEAFNLIAASTALVQGKLVGVAEPMGTWTIPTEQFPAPISFESCRQGLADVLVNIDGALKRAADITIEFVLGRDALRISSHWISTFGDCIKSKNQASFEAIKKANQALIEVYGEVTTPTNSLEAHQLAVKNATPTEDYRVVDLAKIKDAVLALNAAFETVSATVVEEATRLEKASGFLDHVIAVNNITELERILNGHKNPKKPLAKKVIGRKSVGGNDPTVDNAMERVVCIYFTNSLFDHHEIRSALVDASKRSKNAAIEAGTDEPNIVFLRINTKHFVGIEEVAEMMEINELPALRFVNGMQIIPDFNIEGCQSDVVNAVIDLAESIFEEDDDMMGEDEDEEDMDFDYSALKDMM